MSLYDSRILAASDSTTSAPWFRTSSHAPTPARLTSYSACCASRHISDRTMACCCASFCRCLRASVMTSALLRISCHVRSELRRRHTLFPTSMSRNSRSDAVFRSTSLAFSSDMREIFSMVAFAYSSFARSESQLTYSQSVTCPFVHLP